MQRVPAGQPTITRKQLVRAVWRLAEALEDEDAPHEVELPASLEAERAALGAMIMPGCGKATEQGVAVLREAYFTRTGHAVIFAAIHRAWMNPRRGDLPVDVIVVSRQLRSMHKLETVGGGAYLTALIEACPCSANIAAYADEVVACWRMRQYYALSERMRARVLMPDQSPDWLEVAAMNALKLIRHGGADVTGAVDLDLIFQEGK